MVLSRVGLDQIQLFPWSLLHIKLENGRPVASLPCLDLTIIPSLGVISFSGAGANRWNFGSFNLLFHFSVSLQVSPTSIDQTIMNCDDLWIECPGSEPFPTYCWVLLFPWVQTAEAKISPVLRSIKILGSEHRFWSSGRPPNFFIWIIGPDLAQVSPSSVKRDSPISICSCKSCRLLYLIS